MTAKFEEPRQEECCFHIVAAQDRFSQNDTSEENAMICRTDIEFKERRVTALLVRDPE